jgi:hypothetical protein
MFFSMVKIIASLEEWTAMSQVERMMIFVWPEPFTSPAISPLEVSAWLVCRPAIC